MPKKLNFLIKKAEIEEMAQVAQLFREYAAFLQVDLCFQGFEKELSELPGVYAEPQGAILLVYDEDQAVGVVALKPLKTEGTCEMKRLYVKDSHKGLGLGKTLASKIENIAREIGYHTIYLDTLARLETAVKLYISTGYIQTQPYNVNPESDVLYFYKQL